VCYGDGVDGGDNGGVEVSVAMSHLKFLVQTKYSAVPIQILNDLRKGGRLEDIRHEEDHRLEHV